MKVAPLVHCIHCNGIGKRKLPQHLVATYNAIGRLGSPSVTELRNEMKLGGNPSAMNQRVKALLRVKVIRKQNRNNFPPRYVQVNGG